MSEGDAEGKDVDGACSALSRSDAGASVARVAPAPSPSAPASGLPHDADVRVAMGDGWTARVVRGEGAVSLVVGRDDGERALELTVVLTADGPVVRARAASLELESASDITARCRRFRVEARESVELLAGGPLRAEGAHVELAATLGSARLSASDDVRLSGENVLLNCDDAVPLVRGAAVLPSGPMPAGGGADARSPASGAKLPEA